MTKGKEEDMVLYAAPNGRDSWSGRFLEPNPMKTDGPFRTIAGARDAVRKLRKAQVSGTSEKPKTPIRVLIRGGEYRLTKPITFTLEDSGTAKSPITYSAYPGEKSLISGGRQIRGWTGTKVDGKELWTADLPGVLKNRENIRELFVNGERRRRSRLPKKGFYYITGSKRAGNAPTDNPLNFLQFSKGEIESTWKNLTDAEVVVLHYWTDSHFKIKAVDKKNKVVIFQNAARRRLLPGSPYYIENVFEGIEPGEWYPDKKSGKLYYMPLKGEELENVRIIIPKLEKLVGMEGKPAEAEYIEHVHFENLCFAHAAVSFEKIAFSEQAAHEVPGAIQFEGSRNCSVRGCEIANAGTYAIELSNGCCGNSIIDNHIHDMGAGGIKLNGAPLETSPHVSKPSEFTMNNTISNNYIHHCGRMSHCAVGILIRHSGGNTVSNNHIHDLYYTGISVGWVWGYAPSIATGNLIEYNHIHDIGHGWLSDMAGIYTLGLSTGTVIRCNLIHDIKCHRYGAWGIYFDEGTANIAAEQNIVYNCQTGGFFQHYGKNNTVRNNIIGPSKKWHFRRSVEEAHLSFTFKHNIFYIKGGKFLEGKWLKPGYLFDKNLYWRADGKKLKFMKWSFDEWQKRGQDFNSLVADPLFKNPDKGDFTLSPDSPAFRLGFRPIDLNMIGVRKKG